MFGFTIGKLVVLAAVLVGVWIGYKVLGRMKSPLRPSDDESGTASRIDTVYDPETDSYIAKRTGKGSKKG